MSPCMLYGAMATISACPRWHMPLGPPRATGLRTSPKLRCRVACHADPLSFNFAPGSRLDSTVYGCCMPGFTDPLPALGAVGPTDAAAWASYIRAQGVDEVVILLGDDELAMFCPPLPDMYTANGFRLHHIPARSPGAAQRIAAVFKAAEHGGSKVVCHCTGGCHRVGCVLTGWLAIRHGLDYDAAASMVAMTAEAHGVKREVPTQARFEEYVSGTGW